MNVFSAATRGAPGHASKLLLVGDEHFCLPMNFISLGKCATSLDENGVLIAASTWCSHHARCDLAARCGINHSRIDHR